MNRDELETSLKGCPYANVAQLAAEHFTPEFLLQEATGLFNAYRMTEGLRGLSVVYQPSELGKIVVHYVSRELTADLWAVAEPTFKEFLDSDGRFKLDAAMPRLPEPLGMDLSKNLDTGKKFMYDMNLGLYKQWLESIPTKASNGVDLHPKGVMIVLYRAHSALMNGGDMSTPTVIETTFTASGKEYFEWLRDYPDMSRAELEEIVDDSLPTVVNQANQMGINSTAREDVLRAGAETGELSYVFDPASRRIVFNPELEDQVKETEERRRPDFPDQTNLLLTCPAKFVPSTLYHPNGSVLKDILRFRAGMYTELYLHTHGRR